MLVTTNYAQHFVLYDFNFNLAIKLFGLHMDLILNLSTYLDFEKYYLKSTLM